MENRVKLLFVSEEEILRTVLRPFPDHVAKIQHKELPKGYEILRVNYDITRGGFIFMIHHPSFPEVMQGDLIPYFSCDTYMKVYTVKPTQG